MYALFMVLASFMFACVAVSEYEDGFEVWALIYGIVSVGCFIGYLSMIQS